MGKDMSMMHLRRRSWRRAVAIASVLVGTALFVPQQANAAAQDYRFELTGPPVNSGKTTLVKIRLIHVSDGKPVPGAIIIQTRFDMGPEGMASMTAPAKGTASDDPAVYQVETEPSMAGKWGLTLAAKVQGETDTVRGTVTVTVPK